MSEEEKVIFLDEIVERQRKINELIDQDGFIKLFFLYKLEEFCKNKIVEILKQLSGQKSYSEIMDIIVSFLKWYFLVSVCKYLH